MMGLGKYQYIMLGENRAIRDCVGHKTQIPISEKPCWIEKSMLGESVFSKEPL